MLNPLSLAAGALALLSRPGAAASERIAEHGGRRRRTFSTVLEGGQEIWVPGADVMVIRTAIETEVWGRCPE